MPHKIQENTTYSLEQKMMLDSSPLWGIQYLGHFGIRRAQENPDDPSSEILYEINTYQQT